MKETGRHTGRPSPRYRKGFISAWFLSVLLSLCIYSAVLAGNIRNRSLVILNLKREQEYFLAEYPRVREVMCRLQQERIQSEKEEEETEEEPAGMLDDGPVITVEIAGPHPETLLLQIDPETMKVLDCTALRSETDGDP